MPASWRAMTEKDRSHRVPARQSGIISYSGNEEARGLAGLAKRHEGANGSWCTKVAFQPNGLPSVCPSSGSALGQNRKQPNSNVSFRKAPISLKKSAAGSGGCFDRVRAREADSPTPELVL